MPRKLRILLTNDDGFHAPGIRHIHAALRDEHEVTVVAPQSEQSGVGHSFTYTRPLTFQRLPFQNGDAGWAVAGTPADCVKIAIGRILDKKPDMIVSGMNNGNNTGIAAYYSGTVAAVREGAFRQIRSVAFSLCEKQPSYFPEYARVSCAIVRKIADADTAVNIDKKFFFNVNYPACHPGECAGVLVTQQSCASYNDRYEEKAGSGGASEYWLQGGSDGLENGNNFDARAVENGYIAITPLHIDATAFGVFGALPEFDTIF